jgi:tRNA dimethylallyltransferase
MTIVNVLPLFEVIITFTMKEKAPLTHYIIAGPTASGKSAHALELAEKVGGCIVNADSLQIYKGLPILTAQPCEVERQKAPHLLYDFLDPAEGYSAQKWVKDVTAILDNTEIPAILVGGTGLYFKALLEGFSPIPDVDLDVQKRVRDLPLFEARAQLESLDPEMSQRLHPNDHQRNVRALEIILSSGKSLAYWQTLPPPPCPYHFYKIGIFPDKESHETAMKTRALKMWKTGAVEEVEAMMKLDLPQSAPAKKAIGYYEIEDYLRGHLSEAQAQDLMMIKTRQYAKRQRTWFRHQMTFDETINSMLI